jgi:hypothetical protein
VISVILYGRNDAHGYNLHRRAALSLNCLAEVLTDSADEILFVDYNTPDELPTFIEAIADTLTDRCLALLRVLRVPAAIHQQRFAPRTHLPALEPVARNAGVRRANPSNRWLLSTNTDMMILPLVGESLSEACADLPDGFYGLPRFELPEWLWERLPRSDPRAATAAIERLGPGLRLDESTANHEWIRFDAPGDFQLIMRDDFLAIDGFNEEMLLGWHVDSNLSRRMFIRRGSIESLEGRVAGYHCNHSRVPSVFHNESGIANDLGRFVYSVDRAELTEQRSSWGFADVSLEEVQMRQRATLSVADRVASALPSEHSAPPPSDAREAAALTYDSSHVLPFIADSLVVSPSDARVGYIGANPLLRTMLSTLVAELGFDNALLAVDWTDRGSVDDIVGVSDLVVVDLGVDVSLIDGLPSDYLAIEFLPDLERTLAGLERFIELERARIARGDHPRRIVLVNSNAIYWDAFVVSNLTRSYATFHARVSNATVRPTVAEVSEFVPSKFARLMVRFSARRDSPVQRLPLRLGTRVSIADLDDFAGFGDGWAFPDGLGIWTQGRRSGLAVTVEGGPATRLALGIGGVCAAPGESLRVSFLVNGGEVAARGFQSDEGQISAPALRRPLSEQTAQRVKSVLPDRLVERLRPLYLQLTAPPATTGAPRLKEVHWEVALPAGFEADGQLELAVDEPNTPRDVGWSNDDRPLGIHLRSLRFE